jgi:hypothetical protein
MTMNTMTIDCGPELAVALGRRETELEREVRLASALKLFELGRISSGLAARLAVSRAQDGPDPERYTHEYGFPMSAHRG